MKSKFKIPVLLLIVAGLLALVLFFVFRKGDGEVVVEDTVGLDFPAPSHFLSYRVETEYPTSEAIPKPGAIGKVDGAGISVQSHPDFPKAQLRVIRLPKAIQSTEETARILAEAGAIQDCDIILSFRPEWSKFNGYCNIQLGISHTALATIESSVGKKYVKTVESPLNYSSRLNYDHHYAALDLFHILRPNLTGSQKKNVKAWALKTVATDKDKITFFTDYGTPYKDRNLGAPATKNLPVDLAKTVMLPDQGMKVSVYCSELVWAILALRDIDPDELRKEFPAGSGKDPNPWLESRVNPMVAPLPGATDAPLSTPGLMQGPDVVMRALYGSDDEARRKYLLDKVLLTKISNPAETEGHLSTGHAMAANMFRVAKLPGLRKYYGPDKEAAASLSGINRGIKSNYSPTSFFLLANLPKNVRQFNYVATVSFRPKADSAPTPVTTPSEN